MVTKPKKIAGEKQSKEEIKEVQRRIYQEKRLERLAYAAEYYQKNKHKKKKYIRVGRKTGPRKNKNKNVYYYLETPDNVILPKGL